MLPSLPIEIIALVLTFINDDDDYLLEDNPVAKTRAQHLAPVCLASKSFLAIAQRAMYRDIKLIVKAYNDDASDALRAEGAAQPWGQVFQSASQRLRAVLKGSPHLGSLVKNIEFVADNDDDSSMEQLFTLGAIVADFLAWTPRVDGFSFICPEDEVLRCIATVVKGLGFRPRYITLEVGSWSCIWPLLGDDGIVRSLRGTWITDVDSTELLQLPTAASSLTTLDLTSWNGGEIFDHIIAASHATLVELSLNIDDTTKSTLGLHRFTMLRRLWIKTNPVTASDPFLALTLALSTLPPTLETLRITTAGLINLGTLDLRSPSLVHLDFDYSSVEINPVITFARSRACPLLGIITFLPRGENGQPSIASGIFAVTELYSLGITPRVEQWWEFSDSESEDFSDTSDSDEEGLLEEGGQRSEEE